MMATSAVEINSVIHPATRLGAVHLTVSNLDRSVSFYQRVLGFQEHERSDDTVYLFAILTPSRVALAEALRNLIATETRFGGSDHLVSEAIYLSDPDGNGIEIYRDRPRSSWVWEQGQIKMATVPLNYPDILAEVKDRPGGWEGLRPETVIGHIHLHVANLAQAEQFYRDVVGFDLVTRYGGAASFFSAGGYHHHIGANTWAGVGAPPPPADAVGLRYFVVRLPAAAERDRLVQRLHAAGIPFQEREDGLFVRDPSHNGMLFVVNAP